MKTFKSKSLQLLRFKLNSGEVLNPLLYYVYILYILYYVYILYILHYVYILYILYYVYILYILYYVYILYILYYVLHRRYTAWFCPSGSGEVAVGVTGGRWGGSEGQRSEVSTRHAARPRGHGRHVEQVGEVALVTDPAQRREGHPHRVAAGRGPAHEAHPGGGWDIKPTL